jgi:hypothetical protein
MPMSPAEHNDPKWLTVQHDMIGRGAGHFPGWYVIRICPCHFNHQVTLPYESEERAQRARRIILGLEGRSGERHGWVRTAPPLPTAVLPGQVWRRNRLRDNRYMQIIEAHHEKAKVRPVVQTESGTWVRVEMAEPRYEVSYIQIRRLLARDRHGFAPYTLVDGRCPCSASSCSSC